ncbi:MAG: ATP synthase F1 subunit gamma [Ignavibacteria bacterium]|nr:ATP synthase F1 subunit gamma [Ignavibacteria bacterium]
MPTLREIRGRISGVRKTQKITKAMKMVAASKLRRAQSNVIAARPYAAKMRELLHFLSAHTDVSGNPFITPREVRAVALVIVTSDRGLCGAFNSNLIRFALNHVEANYPEAQRNGTIRIFCIGKKGADVFGKRGFHLAGKYIGVYNNLVFPQAQAIVREVVDGYTRGEYDRVEIVYNEFKSVAQQRIVVDQFLPIPKEATQDASSGGSPAAAIDYIFEPSRIEIINALIPRHLNFQVWRILLESNAAEQGARMAAMENATENANELISSLQLQYNKARQAAITKELLEVVSGAEALKKTG